MSKPEKVIIQHDMLRSKYATFVALLNELLCWAQENGMQSQQVTHFVEGFNRRSE